MFDADDDEKFCFRSSFHCFVHKLSVLCLVSQSMIYARYTLRYPKPSSLSCMHR